jgi:hypothetical protein
MENEIYGVSINGEIVAVFADADLAQQFRKRYFGAAVGKVITLEGAMPEDPNAPKPKKKGKSK